MVSTESLLARAVFTMSIRVLGWQPVSQNPGSMLFRKKTSFFLKLLGPVTPLWVLRPSRIVQMVLTESLAARAVFTKTIKMLGWQAGAPKFGSTSFRKKNVLFFEIHRTSDTFMGSLSL